MTEHLLAICLLTCRVCFQCHRIKKKRGVLELAFGGKLPELYTSKRCSFGVPMTQPMFEPFTISTCGSGIVHQLRAHTVSLVQTIQDVLVDYCRC